MVRKAKETTITDADEAAAVLRALAGNRTYRALLAEHARVSHSLGTWHGWLTGRQVPSLQRFLEVVEALGGEVVVRRREDNDS